MLIYTYHVFIFFNAMRKYIEMLVVVIYYIIILYNNIHYYILYILYIIYYFNFLHVFFYTFCKLFCNKHAFLNNSTIRH
jgi:hypothetical protein